MIHAIAALLPLNPILLLGLGALTGFLAGLIGIGGGFVLVPGLLALFTAQGESGAAVMPAVLATTMGCMIFTAAAAAREHARRGSIDRAVLRRLGPFMAAGAAVGACIATVSPTHVVKVAFGVFCLYSAIRMLAFGKRPAASGDRSADASGGVGVPGTLFGAVCGLLGVGGANLVVPFLLRRGLDMRTVVGTASALQVPIALVATIAYMLLGSGAPAPSASIGYVRLPVVAVLAAGSLATAPLGVLVSHRLPVPALKRVFAVFTALVGLKMLGVVPA